MTKLASCQDHLLPSYLQMTDHPSRPTPLAIPLTWMGTLWISNIYNSTGLGWWWSEGGRLRLVDGEYVLTFLHAWISQIRLIAHLVSWKRDYLISRFSRHRQHAQDSSYRSSAGSSTWRVRPVPFCACRENAQFYFGYSEEQCLLSWHPVSVPGLGTLRKHA